MVCLACRQLDPGVLCRHCRAGLRPAPERLLKGGIRVRSAYSHDGPARALVHNLKYRGIHRAGRVLAEGMVPLVPGDAVLVPLTRVRWRRLSRGVDPATELCRHLALLMGVEIADLLVPPWFSPAQAQISRNRRRPPMFMLRRLPDRQVVLIDDVVTTGGTIEQARRTLGPAAVLAVTATASVL